MVIQAESISFLQALARGATSGATWWNWPKPGRAVRVTGPSSRLRSPKMTATEEFHAYPGHQLLTALRDHAADNDAHATATLARRITRALSPIVPSERLAIGTRTRTARA